MSNIASYLSIKPCTARNHYKKVSSGYDEWSQKDHAKDYMVFPENCGDFLSIDKVSLSQGEAYTYITHKQGRGKEGSLVASVKGTKSADIIAVLQKIPYHLRENVQETTPLVNN